VVPGWRASVPVVKVVAASCLLAAAWPCTGGRPTVRNTDDIVAALGEIIRQLEASSSTRRADGE